jgi:phage tail tube protein FII
MTFDTPLESSAIFYRTHLDHRDNATDLAIKLVRKGAEIELQSTVDPFLLELSKVAEPWAIGHLLQGCYIQEYHEWEKGVKAYLKDQRVENNLTDDFDWRSGNKSLIKRTIEALSFFDAQIDTSVMADIDMVREKVNDMKHDPLGNRVDHPQYFGAVLAFQRFWDQMITLEGGIEQG